MMLRRWFILIPLTCFLANLPNPLVAGEADDSDGCPVGYQAVDDACREIAYERRGNVDFEDGANVVAEGLGPGVVLVQEHRRPELICEEAFQEGSESYAKCLGLTKTPCPEGQMFVSGKCRDPKYLERIPKHSYEKPVTIERIQIEKQTKPQTKVVTVYDDPNEPVSPEAAILGETFRMAFDESPKCPQDLIDIEVLVKIAGQARKSGFSTDVSPLIVPSDTGLSASGAMSFWEAVQELNDRTSAATREKVYGSFEKNQRSQAKSKKSTNAQDSQREQPEHQDCRHPSARLTEIDSRFGLSCSYNSYLKEWFPELSVHCENQWTCFDQSNQSLPQNCSEYKRETSHHSQWFLRGKDCTGDVSIRFAGGAMGDKSFVPLGSGVFIGVGLDPDTARGWGLVFAPSGKMIEKEIVETVVVEVPVAERVTVSVEKQLMNDQITVEAWERWAKSSDGRMTLSILEPDERERLLRMLGAAKTHVQSQNKE